MAPSSDRPDLAAKAILYGPQKGNLDPNQVRISPSCLASVSGEGRAVRLAVVMKLPPKPTSIREEARNRGMPAMTDRLADEAES
jgi:hypothetical protein